MGPASELGLRPMDQMHHPSHLPADPVAKLPYINKPLLLLTVRDVGLALVEEENRPGKEGVMNRSKCQKKRLLGLTFPDLGAAGSVVVHRDLAWVCVHATPAATYFCAICLGDLLNKTYKRKPWLRSA